MPVTESVKPEYYSGCKPECGRCQKPVENAQFESTKNGIQVTFSCHNESISYEITTDWYQRISAEKKPFVPLVFAPAAPTPIDEKTQEAMKVAEWRKFIALFVKDKVAQLSGKYADSLRFIEMTMRLENSLDELEADVDVRRLVVGMNTCLGRFEIPVYPGREVKWTESSQ